MIFTVCCGTHIWTSYNTTLGVIIICKNRETAKLFMKRQLDKFLHYFLIKPPNSHLQKVNHFFENQTLFINLCMFHTSFQMHKHRHKKHLLQQKIGLMTPQVIFFELLQTFILKMQQILLFKRKCERYFTTFYTNTKKVTYVRMLN